MAGRRVGVLADDEDAHVLEGSLERAEDVGSAGEVAATGRDLGPEELTQARDDRLDRLTIEDPDTFWTVSRLVEYAHRLGYADGHARGYRDRDREFTVVKNPVEETSSVRAIQRPAQ